MGEIRKIGICGSRGMVGSTVYKYFKERKKYEVYGYSKTDRIQFEEVNSSDLIFICTPTPYNWDIGKFEINIVESALSMIKDGKIVVIKSTILPGTTKQLQLKFPKLKLLFNPEFLSEATAYGDFINPDRQFIGYTKESYPHAIEVLNLLPESAYGMIMPSEQAEMLKYINNIHGCIQVIEANHFYDVCKAMGIDYDKTIKDAQASKWVGVPMGRMYWDVRHKNKRGFGGKCLYPTTKIFTQNGYKEIRDIEIGDKVLTMDGSFQLVKDKFSREIDEDIFEITVQGFEKIYITKEHPLFSFKAGRKMYGKKKRKLGNFTRGYKNIIPVWNDSSKLEKGDYLTFPIVKQKNKKTISSDLMRVLGYYVGDGSIYLNKENERQKQARISFCLNNTTKKYIIKDIKNIIKKEYGLKMYEQKSGQYSIVLRCSSDKLANFLEKHCGKYADRKILSEELMNQNNIGIIEFLKGYYATDGSISTNIYTLVTISEKLFYQIQLLLFSLSVGFRTQIRKKHISKDGVNHKKSFWIVIANYNDIERLSILFGKKIEKDLKLRRMTAFFNENYYFFPIKKVNKIKYKGEVYNLEIEGNETYVTVSGIVHNCFPKDVHAWAEFCKSKKLDVRLIQSVIDINKDILRLQGYSWRDSEKL